jgi:hypothetical protein
MRPAKSFIIQGIAASILGALTVGGLAGCSGSDVTPAQGTPPSATPTPPPPPPDTQASKKFGARQGGSGGMKYNPGNPSEKMQ